MSEKVNKNQETETTKKEVTKKPVAKTEKKENWFKRTGRKIRNGMEKHPFWTAFGGAAVGSATTVGLGYAGKKIMEGRRERRENAYIQNDPNNE
ncbi:MAG: hypothetical protein LIR46_02975 [Bacteroidota bacterium]|nr:hypothetical protein [Bacteroidota bacterium]